MQRIKRRTKIRQRIVVSLLVLIITIYICAGFLMYSWVGILYINLIKDAPLFYPWSTPGWWLIIYLSLVYSACTYIWVTIFYFKTVRRRFYTTKQAFILTLYMVFVQLDFYWAILTGSQSHIIMGYTQLGLSVIIFYPFLFMFVIYFFVTQILLQIK